MRGKHSNNTADNCNEGITPAGAGKTSVDVSATMYLTDHPRRCGENVTKFGMLTSLIGSPPQVRGKQEKMKILLTLLRITPAGAGKTNKMIFDELEVWDHPRRCGENAQALNDLDADKGSPPQVRGKQSFAVLPPLRTRITPAGAGKTEFAPLSVHVTEDHPRRCGENYYQVL